jgi:integrase
MTRILRDIYENEYAVLRAHSEQCRRQYRLTLTRWADQLRTEPTVEHLDPLIVQTYVASRRAVRSAATARKDRNQISALWSYCAKRRYVDQFPTLAQIRAPGRIPRGYTVDEVSALIRQALQRRPRIKPTTLPPHEFFPSLIRSCWETAERIGSHMALRWRDVDTTQRIVIFPAEGRKGATRDILRTISEDQCKWLEQIRGKPDDLVWPWKADKSTLWHHFGLLCKRAGVTNRGFHGLRKSAASYMALAGGDAAATQLLDHSNPAITKAHYIDVTIAKPKQTAIDLLPPLDLTPKPPTSEQPPEKPAGAPPASDEKPPENNAA